MECSPFKVKCYQRLLNILYNNRKPSERFKQPLKEYDELIPHGYEKGTKVFQSQKEQKLKMYEEW